VHPPRVRFVAREVGPTTIGALVVALALLWIVARPTGEPAGSYIGQLLGAESILLLSIGLVLISTLPWVEEWFDGIDRAAVWHRRVAITGLVLLRKGLRSFGARAASIKSMVEVLSNRPTPHAALERLGEPG